MDGDVLAESIVIANAQAGRLVFIFQVLRRVTDDAAGVKDIARTNCGQPG